MIRSVGKYGMLMNRVKLHRTDRFEQYRLECNRMERHRAECNHRELDRLERNWIENNRLERVNRVNK
jgi:hypothetical protein